VAAGTGFAARGGWSGLLRHLVTGGDLTTGEASEAMGEILAGAATPAQIAGFVVALRMKGETVAEMAGFVDAMLAAAERVPVPQGCDPVDTCSTGGGASRGVAAFNVSTIAAFVVAGAGAPVCKHGNRRATSTSGSFDLLEALGVVIDLGPAGVARCLADAGMGVCFAPRFHASMRHAGPTRRELGVPTVFNFLGPLANPAGVRRQVVGVSDAAMAERMAGVLVARGAERALVVHGHDGLDELTIGATSTVHDVADGEVRVYEVDPAHLGIARHEGPVVGGDVAVNADLAARVLGGEHGPHRDIVSLNAAAGLVAAGVAEDLARGHEAACAAIDAGAAGAALDRLVAVSRQAREALGSD
jgi:anthranilate phosphoribosyltransferase